ncbi:hypothetical protein RQM47_14275 [Rubrivirga sp. S365]|uniref:Uncharacterized protein n=1 Tax=Rubrivirga litoralis TaxID=3075598 RepID=A0ABU3BU84_9BACT|nr:MULTISPECIES: hypothetical protein [unclassified Rubrivirga]MDT0632721.1 hypothetical protein [Rubrivirga sp. F394]MDT7857813.1 hypothetical protein [Rubrivirga sp. S365]
MPETDPAITPTCAHCGSDAVIPDAFLYPKDSGGGTGTLQLGLHRNPSALMLKQTERTDTRVQVCGDCGFVALFSTDARALWDAHVDRLSREFGA